MPATDVPAEPPARPRRGPERRIQLLAAAGELVAERGLVGFTMEGLAARAGVSKALPYRHFDNADDVLVALYTEEVTAMGARIVAATTGRTGDDSLQAAVHAYFDVIAQRGMVLGTLAGAGSHVPALAAAKGTRQGADFLAGLIRRAYGLDTAGDTTGLGRVVGGCVQAAGDAWGRRELRRRSAEALAVAAATAAVRAHVDGSQTVAPAPPEHA